MHPISQSDVLIPLIQVFFGLVMLAGGGEVLVSGAVAIARRMGMRPLIVGMTIVAFGTSMPEMFVSMGAALSAHPGIMLGNVIGSNIANIGLVLALALVLAPIACDFRQVRVEMLLLGSVSIVVWIAAFYGFFPRILGLLMIAALVLYTVAAIRGRHDGNGKKDKGARPLWLALLMLGGGLALLAVGSSIFITGAAVMARLFGVSELVIGLTLAAVGTSLPELASSLAAVRRREQDILIGNIIGSNMFNLMMVMAATGVVVPFAMGETLWRRDIPWMAGFPLALGLALYFGSGLKRRHGVVLFLAYIVYIFTLA